MNYLTRLEVKWDWRRLKRLDRSKFRIVLSNDQYMWYKIPLCVDYKKIKRNKHYSYDWIIVERCNIKKLYFWPIFQKSYFVCIGKKRVFNIFVTK